MTAKGYGVSLGGGENVLELDSGDCTNVWPYSTPLNCLLCMGGLCGM